MVVGLVCRWWGEAGGFGARYCVSRNARPSGVTPASGPPCPGVRARHGGWRPAAGWSARPSGVPLSPLRAPRAAELAGMKLGGLRTRAKALGGDAAALEEVIDEADDPKGAMIQMILAMSPISRLLPRRSRRRSA